MICVEERPQFVLAVVVRRSTNWRFSESTFLFLNFDSDIVNYTPQQWERGGRAAMFIIILFSRVGRRAWRRFLVLFFLWFGCIALHTATAPPTFPDDL